MSNTRTRFSRDGSYRACFHESGEGEALLAALLPDPDRVLAEGEELLTAWYAGNTKKGFFTCLDKRYFYKTYQPKGVLYGVKNIFRRSRAARAWHYAEVFARLAIPTIPPVLCLEKRWCRLLGPAYLVFPMMEGWDNLLNQWGQLADDRKKECMAVSGDLIGRMHRHGLLHGDLNWRNLLFSTGTDPIQGAIIDLDGCKTNNNQDIHLMQSDLAHFVRDIERCGAENWAWEYFQRSWQRTVEQAPRAAGKG